MPVRTRSIIAPYVSGELDQGAASVGGLVVWGRPRQLARSAVETSARPREDRGASSAEMAKSGSIELEPLPTTTTPIGELRYAKKVLSVNFSTSHCALRPAPHVTGYGQAAACSRAAQKTQTYRSLRFPAEAALVPSAGTITLQIELRSDADAVSTLACGACPRCAACVPTHQKGDTGYRGGPREARHSRAPNFDIAKAVQNR